MASEKTTKKDLVKAEEQQQASVVDRVTSLPLLNSAFNLVSSAYNHTKETHPCLSGVCNVAETVAAVAVGSVVGGAQPILNQLEPQIALVNEYACKGLNQLEENLPFLQQPADKVISDTKLLVSTKVTSAMDAACEAKESAKDLVTNTVTEAVDRTKGAVQDSVEKTKSMVASTVNTALDAAVSQAVAGGVESVLGISEDLVDHYLPVTEEELGELATSVEGFGVASVEEQKQQQSYFVRLGSLSSKVRHRAYQLSLNKLRCVKQSTQETLSRLQLAIKLIESVKQEVGQKLLDGQEKLHQLWVDWSLTQPKGNQVKTASQPEVESRTLAMLRIITQQLQPAYENLKASIHGLPSNIQEAVYQATRNIRKLHSSFSSAMSFQDLSSTTLTQSQDYVAEARRSLDDLFEYVTHNIPLNWLVGPFRAIAKASQDSGKQTKKDTVTDRKSPVLEKATSSKGTAKAPEEPKGVEKATSSMEVAKAPEEPKGVAKAPEEPKGVAKAPEEPKGVAKAPEEPKGVAKAPEEPKGVEKAPSSVEVAKAPEEPKGVEKSPSSKGVEKKAPKKPKGVEKKAPEEPKGANRIPEEGCEVLEKLEEKTEKDTEVALAAKEIKTNAPEEDP
ncbi:perilipin-3-like [Numenius arquata]|uniref:perilipin-3-like n=1 Tax=Numenius arquata TaxID=31919 RepID=UPI003D30621C